MYFVVVKEILTGKIVDKAELSPTLNMVGDLAQSALLTKRNFERQYTSENYSITFEKADSWEELKSKNVAADNDTFRMIGSRTYQLIVSIAAMIGGTFLMFILMTARLIFNPFLFIVGFFLLFLYLAFDYSIWIRKGIHMIEIDKNGFTVYYGTEMIPVRIDKKQITGINFFKKLNRRNLNISLGGNAEDSIPGITLFSGPRIRITDEAFNEAEFRVFVKLIYELRPDINLNLDINTYKK